MLASKLKSVEEAQFFVSFEELLLSPQQVALVAKALVSPQCTLNTLDLSSCLIGDAGALELSQAFKTGNCPIHELLLSGNEIFAAGAQHIATILKYPTRLTRLHLHMNRLYDSGARVLATALTHPNCQLKFLNIAYNLIKTKGAIALIKAVRSDNCRLIHIVVDENENCIEFNELCSIISTKRRQIARDEARDKWYTFCLGRHDRVGESSEVGVLVTDVFQLVFEHFWPNESEFYKK